MKIDCISDLHGHYPKLEGGDLLIVAGDLTARDTFSEYSAFMHWLWEQNYVKKVFIAGNHDNKLEEYLRQGDPFANCECEYLCDSGMEFEGLKIWGSPWTPYFEGVNPKCAAFMKPDKELQAHWDIIPADVDILVTHGPPYGILDEVVKWSPKGDEDRHAGSPRLFNALYGQKIKPKLHIFGHIHEAYGIEECPVDIPGVKFVNCSHVNINYEPVNKPIRIEL